MFYLTFLAKLWARGPLKSLAFILFGTGLLVLGSHYSELEKALKNFYRVDPPGATFHALVPGRQNSAWMARKVRELPGVKNAEVISQDDIKKSLGDAGQGLPEEVLKMDYTGLKVTFVPGLSVASQNLIRDYLSRLSGAEGQVTLGRTHSPDEVVLAQRKPLEVTQHYALPGALVLCGIFWVLAFFAFEKGLREASYLVEKFQRRRGVGPKAMALHQILVVLIGTGASLFWGSPEGLNLALGSAIMVLVAVTQLRKFQWPEG